MLKHSVGLPVGIHRRVANPSLMDRVARALDRLITRTQEWLEAPGHQIDRCIAEGVLIGFAVYLALQIVRAVLLR